MAGHVAPEAPCGGPIAAVREGDTVTFDVRAAAWTSSSATRDRRARRRLERRSRVRDRRAREVRPARSRAASGGRGHPLSRYAAAAYVPRPTARPRGSRASLSARNSASSVVEGARGARAIGMWPVSSHDHLAAVGRSARSNSSASRTGTSGSFSPQTISVGHLDRRAAGRGSRSRGSASQRVVEAGLAGALDEAPRTPGRPSAAAGGATTSASASVPRDRARGEPAVARRAVGGERRRRRRRERQDRAPRAACARRDARRPTRARAASTRSGNWIATSAADEAAHRVADDARPARAPSCSQQRVDRPRRSPGS